MTRIFRQLVLLIAAMGILAVPVFADTVVIDFESMANLQNVATYLAGYGITISNIDAGSGLVAFDEGFTYGGGVVNAPSGKMYITQAAIDGSGAGTGGAAAPPPNAFTLNFSTALDSFGFSDSAILLPSINSPWTAMAYSGVNGTGSLLASTSYTPPSVHATANFVLAGAGIRSVVINQTPSPSAAFYAGNFDNFVLSGPGVSIPEPASLWLLGSGLAGLMAFRRKR